MNFKAVLTLPKTAPSAQTYKSITFIWIVWSTLYVYLWYKYKFLSVKNRRFAKLLSLFINFSHRRKSEKIERIIFTEKSNPRWNLIKLMGFTISSDIFLIFVFILNVCDINGCLTSRRDNWNFCKKRRPRFLRHKAVCP